jgi:predicted anti-sigma-YlaC factor YlaD
VRCDRFREAASARLDGEPTGLSSTVLDKHLASCPDCARWQQRATKITRSVRVGSADVPDLADRILADVVLPARRVLRRRRWLGIALFAVGIAQLALALPALFGDSIDMAMSMHAAHETAAWNLALGAAFLATAYRPRRAAGLLPLLAAFVGILSLLSIRDLAGGSVAVGRLATHLAAVVGLVLVYALDRVERAGPPERVAATGAEIDRPRHGGLRGVA